MRSVSSQNQAWNDGRSSDCEVRESKLIHLVMRIVIYCIGLVMLAAGIVVQTKSGLGVAALTCFATALAAVLHVTLGSMVFATYVIYVAIQAWITRKHFRPKILLELLFSAMMVLRSVLSAFLQKACSEASRRSISRKYFHAE